MSPSAQLTSEQPKEIIEAQNKTGQGSREVQEQVHGEAALHPDNTSSVMRGIFHTINNAFDSECLDGTVKLLNAHRIA
jgi:hypothetical protein